MVRGKPFQTSRHSVKTQIPSFYRVRSLSGKQNPTEISINTPPFSHKTTRTGEKKNTKTLPFLHQKILFSGIIVLIAKPRAILYSFPLIALLVHPTLMKILLLVSLILCFLFSTIIVFLLRKMQRVEEEENTIAQ